VFFSFHHSNTFTPNFEALQFFSMKWVCCKKRSNLRFKCYKTVYILSITIFMIRTYTTTFQSFFDSFLKEQISFMLCNAKAWHYSFFHILCFSKSYTKMSICSNKTRDPMRIQRQDTMYELRFNWLHFVLNNLL
jgi:hypothetical protein